MTKLCFSQFEQRKKNTNESPHRENAEKMRRNVASTLCWPLSPRSCIIRPSPRELCIGISQYAFVSISIQFTDERALNACDTRWKNVRRLKRSIRAQCTHTHIGFFVHVSFQFQFEKILFIQSVYRERSWQQLNLFYFCISILFSLLQADECGCVDLKQREQNPFANPRFSRAIVRVDKMVW